MKDAMENILTRRSTRSFRKDPVSEELLNAVIEAGRHAPSGGNNQTTHFLVIRNREALSALASLAEEAFAKMEITENTLFQYLPTRKNMNVDRSISD